MSTIKDIIGREILDSRGNPTIEVELTTDDNITVIAGVPSGASTGTKEALELRDNDKTRYLGKGVLKPVSNINNIIKPNLIGLDIYNQKEIDNVLMSIDGTKDKSNLGANAILGVSLASIKAAALSTNQELYEYLGAGRTIPKCMMNILNGGAHADNGLNIQEFMIIPSTDDYKKNLQIGAEVFHNLKKILKESGNLTGVGDEGGFAPKLENTKTALDLIIKAIETSGYIKGKDVNLALDVAASEFYKNGIYYFEGKEMTSNSMIDYYQKLIEEYPIISIEDGLSEDDYEGWKELTSKLGDKIWLVGDDLFTTNKELLQKGIDEHFANAILIKLNQIGTVTETLETINLAKQHHYKIIISHRSGETEDTSIADFAVGLNLGQIKTGSVSRGERIAKYNRLLRIYEKCNK